MCNKGPKKKAKVELVTYIENMAGDSSSKTFGAIDESHGDSNVRVPCRLTHLRLRALSHVETCAEGKFIMLLRRAL